MRTAFITGCSSGFGHALTLRLLNEGYRVVATAPDPVDLEAMAEHPELLRLPLDIRDDDQVRWAVSMALDQGPVDLLVNNAGYAVFGTQEEVDVALVRELFETNVFGHVRVTQALLPTLRAQSGTVVQLSSVAARIVFPESGFYAATKFALEALTEALFQETQRFGVKVRLIRPGSFDTGFLDTARELSPPRAESSPYAPDHDAWDAQKLAVLEPPQNKQLVVDAIMSSLHDPTPFMRVAVGRDAERLLEGREELAPDSWRQG